MGLYCKYIVLWFHNSISNKCISENAGAKTLSNNFPINADSYDQVYNGDMDACLVKLSFDGQTILASTYFGGPFFDQFTDLQLGTGDGVCTVGLYESCNLPTTPNAIDSNCGGEGIRDAMIVKFGMNLDTLLYSSYLGGSEQDVAEVIVFDDYDNAYIVGYTGSEDFPVTLGVIAEELFYGSEIQSPEYDGFVLKMNFCPSAMVSGDNELCSGDTLQLESFGGATYSWTGPNDFNTTEQNPVISGITETGTGTYIVTAVSGGSNGELCADTASIFVQVNALPVVTLSLPDSLCVVSPLIPLESGEPSGGAYFGPGIENGFLNTSVAGLGIHQITYSFSDEYGCFNSATEEIHVLDCVNVNEHIERSVVNIYPNPFSDQFTITSFQVIKNIRITNALGQVVYSGEFASKYMDLSPQLVPGIYQCQLQVGNGKYLTARLVKL